MFNYVFSGVFLSNLFISLSASLSGSSSRVASGGVPRITSLTSKAAVAIVASLVVDGLFPDPLDLPFVVLFACELGCERELLVD